MDYVLPFPCPHCQHLFDTTLDGSALQVVCPNCGVTLTFDGVEAMKRSCDKFRLSHPRGAKKISRPRRDGEEH